MAKNIYLDFLNRASGELYGLSDRGRAAHVECLVEALNVAAFFCGEYCLMPPLFLAECPRVRRAVVRRMEYCTEGLIQFSMRERTFDEYFDKKDVEYPDHRDQYGDLFDEKTRNFVRRQKVTILTRDRVIGNELVTRWQEDPDLPGFFREIINLLGMDAPAVETIRAIPERIRSVGGAVTWPAIRAVLDERNRPPDFDKLQRVVQHLYFMQYLESHNLTILTGLPFTRGLDFGLCRGDYSHDWRVLNYALRIAGCWDVVRTLSARSIFDLRTEPGFFVFRDAVVRVGSLSRSVQDAFRVLSTMTSRLNSFRERDGLLSLLNGHKKKVTGVDLPRQALQALGQLLTVAAAGVEEFTGKHLLLAKESVTSGWTQRSDDMPAKRANMSAGGQEAVPVAVYCALDEERRRLTRRWNLTAHTGTDYWSGTVEGVNCMLYSSTDMGRVSAAVATMKFLASFSPGCIVAMGIAGGFSAEGVLEGDLIIPAHIADLAIRKIREDKQDVIPEFRFRPFETSTKVVSYLAGSRFDRSAWVTRATEEADYPDNRRPNIHFSSVTLACSDEVVSSSEWTGTLLAAWPQLKGVEMEAGGVCAAARASMSPLL